LTRARSTQPTLSLVIARKVSDNSSCHQPVSGNEAAPGMPAGWCLGTMGLDWPTLNLSIGRIWRDRPGGLPAEASAPAGEPEEAIEQLREALSPELPKKADMHHFIEEQLAAGALGETIIRHMTGGESGSSEGDR